MKRKLLSMALLAISALGFHANAENWTSGAEVSTGEYYLYNVGADRYLNRGHAYKFRTLLDGGGAILTLSEGSTNYRIQFEGVSNAYMGKDLYADKSTTDGNYSEWVFEKKDVDSYENVYLIKSVATGQYLNWGGINTNSETDFADQIDNNNGYWLLIPKNTRQDLSNASEDSPVDVTYLVQNPDFEQNISQSTSNTSNLHGWTGGLGYHDNNASVGFGVFVENWVSSTGAVGNLDFYQMITSQPIGKYRLVVDAFAARQNQDNKADVSGIYVYLNSVEESVATGEQKANFTLNADVLDGTIIIGMKTLSATANWVGMDNVRLYYLGVEALELTSLQELYTSNLEVAKAVDMNKLMNADVKSTLRNAIEKSVDNTSKSELAAAIDALKLATTAANNSIAAYANSGIDIDAFVEAIKPYVETTNVYTEEAYNKWVVNVQENYNNGEYTDAEVVNLNANGAFNTGWHSSSLLLQNVLLSAWTIGGEQAKDYLTALYINTWSTEGAGDGTGFNVPFLEYWTADANSLDANTIVGTVTDLPAGAYEISAWVRVRAKDGTTAAEATGVTLSVNGGNTIDVTEGASVGQFNIAEYKARGVVGEDGKLTITFNVAADNNVSWLSFKNVMWKAVESVTASISEIGYATFSSEFALDLSKIDGGTAYIVTDDAVEGNYIKLTEQTEAVPANTGLIIAGDGIVTIPVVATASDLDKKNYLVAGTGAAAPQGSYVLSCKYKEESTTDWDLTTVGFYSVDKEQPIVEKGKAYLELPANTDGFAKALYFVFGDNLATAIETAEVADTDADGAIYNVAGQQVGKDYKGIVIKNGKKYLNK